MKDGQDVTQYLPFNRQTSSESSVELKHIALTLKAGICQPHGKDREPDNRRYSYTNAEYIIEYMYIAYKTC